MHRMTPRERFLAAIEGRALERPPVTAWVHFLSDHLSGAEAAGLHLKFQRAYEWDLVKVMNDYRYPVPPGVDTLAEPQALERYCARPRPDVAREPCFAEQLACLAAGGQRALDALEAICQTMCAYIAAARRAGADGFFLSVNGAIREGMPRALHPRPRLHRALL